MCGGRLAACDLCAIYSANSARSDLASGLTFTLNEQFVSYGTLQKAGEPYDLKPKNFLTGQVYDLGNNHWYDSITHLVPGYNITPDIGVSLNIPFIYRSYRRVALEPTGEIIDQTGSTTGLGDVSLIGRWTAYKKVKMSYSILFNVMGGVKFPTGDTAFLDREIAQERQLTSQFGPVHVHSYSGVHLHDLTLGSGSFDGIFGTALNLRWKRWFFNQQFQYYMRTAYHDYTVGDWIIVSGGPGVYLLSNDDYTLSLQANTYYESMAQDFVLGRVNDQTGYWGWFVGPQVVFTLGDHFSAQAAVELPITIGNHGIQDVQDYRIRAGFKWRF
jgi:hypothetical protein